VSSKAIKILGLTAMLLTSIIFDSMADTYALGIADVNSRILQQESGSIIDGRWFDSNGNRYSIRQSDKRYVNSENKFVSLSELNTNNKFEELSRKFETEGYVQLNTYEEAENLFNYYSAIYTLYNSNVYATIHSTSITTLTHNSPKTVNNKYVKQLIIDKFGVPVGETEYEILYDACQRVSAMDIDYDYLITDLTTSVNGNAGVCRQYAKVLNVLLEEAGLESECVLGTLEGGTENENHMWNKTCIDGTWVYSDPLRFDSEWVGYYNINYNTYIKMYTQGSAFTN
jgi:hypothetical protein